LFVRAAWGELMGCGEPAVCTLDNEAEVASSGTTMAVQSETRFGYVPHFEVTTVDGSRVRYRDIWQHRNLVLVIVAPDQRSAAVRYAQQLADRQRDFEDAETSVVVSTDSVRGLTPPRVVIADRWGEILHTASAPGGDVSQLLSVDEVLSWVGFVRIQCPECPP
jgi:hypothetical protein